MCHSMIPAKQQLAPAGPEEKTAEAAWQLAPAGPDELPAVEGYHPEPPVAPASLPLGAFDAAVAKEAWALWEASQPAGTASELEKERAEWQARRGRELAPAGPISGPGAEVGEVGTGSDGGCGGGAG